MTWVTVSEQGERYKLTARGHAQGSEAVCAAVSALCYSLAAWLINALKAGGDLQIHEMDMGDACARFDFEGGNATRAAFELVLIGLAQLAQQYPQYINIDLHEFEPEN